MANYLTDIIRRAEKYGAKNNLGRLLSALEVGANMGTSSIAQMGGGLSYVPAAIMGGDKAGQAVKGSVERAFTYEPRTQGARNFFNKVGEYSAPVMQYGGQKVEQAADAAFAATGSPVIGAAVKTLPTALSVAADRIRIGRAAPDRMDMTAYHGSPHDFDEFSLSKIGTGEGAQAYGHGLYFAESPYVAREYRRNLSESGGPAGEAAKLVRMYRDNAIDVAKSDLGKGSPEAQHFAQQVVDILESGNVNQGRLYTVDIPDESVAKFLDWDKPLSEQPESVKKAFSDFVNSPEGDALAREFWSYKEGNKLTDLPEWKDPYGETIHKVAFGGGERATNWYMKNGIPGIRYLDQGSRQGGKGTSNFVVFDDKLVKVLKKE